MKKEEVPEEHRKFLDMEENPKRVSNTSIFALVSDEFTKLKVSMGKLEQQQTHSHEQISKLDGKLEKSIEATDDKIESIEDDLKKCQVSGMGTRATNEEKFTWIMRAIKLTIILSGGTLTFLFYHMGLPFFFP